MNNVKLTGVFMGLEFSHETHKEKFYTGTISTKRHSGSDDIIPIMVSERLLDKMVSEGQRISIDGEYRSYNKIDNGKSKCMLFVFVKNVYEASEKDENTIELEGFICRNTGVRQTPQHRTITDIIVAVNRITRRSDYIPCIVWGDRAKYVAGFDIGTKVSLLGRIQSRQYDKSTSNGIEKRIAYEVSVSEIGKVEPDTVDLDENLFEDLDLFSDIDNNDNDNK